MRQNLTNPQRNGTTGSPLRQVNVRISIFYQIIWQY